MRTVPRQRTGASSSTSYQVKAKSTEAAKEIYRATRENLLHVNGWHEIAGPASARFQVVDNTGKPQNGHVKKGNYLRISIPIIPNAPKGTGDDWVRVEMIDEHQDNDEEYTSIRVRPCACPVDENDSVAHFFDEHATSTFTVQRNGRRVRVSVIGRNEKPNTNTSGLLSILRNFFIAAGAMIGLNKPQWKSLAKGLVTKSLQSANASS